MAEEELEEQEGLGNAAEFDENEEFGEDSLAADAIDGLDDDLGKKKLSGKKFILFIVLPLFLIFGVGGGLYFSGALDGLLGKDKTKQTASADAGGDGMGGYDLTSDSSGYFYEIPDIIVNLSGESRKQRFLKLSVSVELESQESVPKLESVMPRVNDHFQTYLRELRISDLQGSAGVYRLRQELLSRVRAAAYPVEVKDVLFSEILVQ